MSLPSGVHVIRKPSGRVYYYWQPGRGTAHQQGRVRLPDDPFSAEFAEELRVLKGEARRQSKPHTFARLVADYTGSPDFARLSEATRKDYTFYLERVERVWGALMVRDLRASDVLAWRDAHAETPSAANHGLAVLQTLIGWGVPRDYRADNPVREIGRFDVDAGTKDWPDEVVTLVLASAPQDIYRAVYLCLHTGQRQTDVFRARPADRDGAGLRIVIQKLGGEPHWVPLSQEAIREIDGWGVGKLDLYTKSTSGQPFTQQSFGARWQRFLRGCKPVREAIEEHGLTIHGLRATAVVRRRRRGLSEQVIAAQINMSLGMVMRYSKKANQRMIAAAGQEHLDRGRKGL